MRVLHLIDQGSPQACATTLALMGESRGRLGRIVETSIVIGTKRFEVAAAKLGAPAELRLPAARNSPVFAASRLRSALRDMPSADLIHCWSIASLSLAALLRRGTPRLLTVTHRPDDRAMRWLRTLMHDAPAPTVLLPISATLRRELLSAGLPEASVHVLRPGLDQSRVQHNGRVALRQRWRVEGARPAVVAFLGDPVDAVDAHDAVFVAMLADGALGSKPGRITALVHPRQQSFRRALLMLHDQRRPDLLIQDAAAAHPWDVLPGCDIAIAMGPGAGGMSLLWAMAANIPIIGEATYANSEIVEDRHSALLAQPDSPQALAHRVTQLLDDQQLAWKLKDTARHEAYSFFSRKRYCESLVAVYEQVTSGQPIDVPDLEVTGGMRFTGRA